MSCHHGHSHIVHGCGPVPDWDDVEYGPLDLAPGDAGTWANRFRPERRRAMTTEQLEARLAALRDEIQRVEWRIEAIREHDPIGSRRQAAPEPEA